MPNDVIADSRSWCVCFAYAGRLAMGTSIVITHKHIQPQHLPPISAVEMMIAFAICELQLMMPLERKLNYLV